MRPGLKQAATTGDSEWLRNNVESKPHTYWLCRAPPSDDSPYAGNILHLAIQRDHKRFAEDAMRLLPPEVAHLLSRHQETGGGFSDWNPLHLTVARRWDNLAREIVKCDDKVRTSNGLQWLHICPDVATDNQGRTPAILAIQMGYPARSSFTGITPGAELLTSENRAPLIHNIEDCQHNSPLFVAVYKGLQYIVTNLLCHCENPLHTGPGGLTALHIAPRLLDGYRNYIWWREVAKDLFTRLEKYINSRDENGFTLLHKWVEQMDSNRVTDRGTWDSWEVKEKWEIFGLLFEMYRRKAIDLMSSGDKDHNNNPLHHLVNLTSEDSAAWTAKHLLESYKRCSQSDEEEEFEEKEEGKVPLLLMENKHGSTPLVWAIQKKCQKLAKTLLEEYPIDALCAADHQHKNPLLHAAYHECYDVGKEILNKMKNHLSLKSLLPFDDQPPESILRYAADFPVTFMSEVTLRLRTCKDLSNWDPITLGSWEEYKVFNSKKWPEMDLELKNAACSGAVQFLEEAVKTKPWDYWLCRSSAITDDPEGTYGGNILHLAVWHRQKEFVKQVIEMLPLELVNLLQLHKETVGVLRGWNPLHLAVHRNNDDLVKMIIIHQTHSDAFTAQDSLGKTPALLAIQLGHQQCAEILTREQKFESWSNAELIQGFQGIPDEQGNSLLYLAVRNGFDKVSMNLLDCRGPLSCSGPNGSTVLHVMTGILHDWGKQGTTGSALFKRFTDLVDNVDNDGLTMLHKWVKMEDARFNAPRLQKQLKSLLNYFFNTYPEVAVELMLKTDLKNGNNPLHVLATNSISLDSASSNVVQEISRLYNDSVDKVIEKEPSKANNLLLNLEPLLLKRNNAKKMPLQVAIDNKLQDLAWYFFEECPVDSLKSLRCDDQNPLKLALDNECYQLVKNMLDVLDAKDLTSLLKFGADGSNVLHYASAASYPQWIVKEVVEKFPNLCDEPDDNNHETPLDKAAATGKLWLVQLILRNNPDSLSKARHAWQRACEEGHELVLKCFMKECPSFRGICLGSRDTPLHHMKPGKWNYAKYTELLDYKVFTEFINEQDKKHLETPLHRAIREGDIELAEALFKMDDIDLHIKDNEDKTAMDLLQRYKDDKEWIAMCKRVGIDPALKTTYVQRRKDLLNIRDTLLVVAALLGAITFQAGFTLPGGLDQNTGEALRAKKSAFLAFLIADVYAFCCSMLVIFCLVWSMFSDSSKTILWIDYSMSILLHALYATLIAFMTGVYTVISPKASWAAILTIVMCSVIGISSFEGSILYSEITVLKRAWKKFLEMLGNVFKRCCGCCFKGDASRSANMNFATNTNVTTININP